MTRTAVCVIDKKKSISNQVTIQKKFLEITAHNNTIKNCSHYIRDEHHINFQFSLDLQTWQN